MGSTRWIDDERPGRIAAALVALGTIETELNFGYVFADAYRLALSRRGILFGTPASAALPAVFAATDPSAIGGRFYGPSGLAHLSGAPAEQKLYSRLTSEAEAKRVWDVSAELAGVSLST